MFCLVNLTIVMLLYFFESVLAEEEILYTRICVTPDSMGSIGSCTSIFNCPKLLQMRLEQKPEGIDYIKSSLCATCEADEIWVCCPLSEITSFSLVMQENNLRNNTTIAPTKDNFLTNKYIDAGISRFIYNQISHIINLKKFSKYCINDNSSLAYQLTTELSISSILHFFIFPKAGSIFDCPVMLKLDIRFKSKVSMDISPYNKHICIVCPSTNASLCCKNRVHDFVMKVDDHVKEYSNYYDVNIHIDYKPSKANNNLMNAQKTIKKANLDHLKSIDSICGQEHSAYRSAVNQAQLSYDDFPWMVQIKHSVDEPLRDRCNGVIIDRRYVLTTSKCGYLAKTVLVGQYNTNTKQSCMKWLHENYCTEETLELSVDLITYSGELENDELGISLLKLNETIIFGDYVRPICLPINKTDLYSTYEELEASGWGLSENGGDKKSVFLKVLNFDHCYAIDDMLREKVLKQDVKLMCLLPQNKHFGNVETVPCTFDYGGPLMYKLDDVCNKWYVDSLIAKVYSSEREICGNSSVSAVYLTPDLINFIAENLDPS